MNLHFEEQIKWFSQGLFFRRSFVLSFSSCFIADFDCKDKTATLSAFALQIFQKLISFFRSFFFHLQYILIYLFVCFVCIFFFFTSICLSFFYLFLKYRLISFSYVFPNKKKFLLFLFCSMYNICFFIFLFSLSFHYFLKKSRRQ